jgi:hypothetical protein
LHVHTLLALAALYTSDAPLESEQSAASFEVGVGTGTNRTLWLSHLRGRWTATPMFAFELGVPAIYFDSAEDPRFASDPTAFMGDGLELGNINLVGLFRTPMGAEGGGRFETGVGFAFGTADEERTLQLTGAAAIDGFEHMYAFLPGYASLFVPVRFEVARSRGFLFRSTSEFIAYLPTSETIAGGGLSTRFDLGYRGGWFDATLGAGTSLALLISDGDVFASVFLEPRVRLYTTSEPFVTGALFFDLRFRGMLANEGGGGADYGAFAGVGLAF